MNNTEKKTTNSLSLNSQRACNFICQSEIDTLTWRIYNITHVKYKSSLEKIKNHLLQS